MTTQKKYGNTYGGLTEWDVFAIGSQYLEQDPPNHNGMITYLREAGCTSSEIFEILTKFRNGEL
jgi:hypothetical protein